MMNHQRTLELAEKFLGTISSAYDDGASLVRRFWHHRACCGLDHMRQAISDLAPLQTDFAISGPKNRKVVQFHAEVTNLEIDFSKPVGECLVGRAVVPIPLAPIKRNLLNFSLIISRFGARFPNLKCFLITLRRSIRFVVWLKPTTMPAQTPTCSPEPLAKGLTRILMMP